jgi:hypothetical protein
MPIYFICFERYIMSMIAPGQLDGWACHGEIAMGVAEIKGGDPSDVMYMAAISRLWWAGNS